MTRAERVRRVRARCRILRWEYRQRHLAHGAWGKFREALAMAAVAYAIDPATADALVGEGFRTDERGARLEPPRRIVWITEDRATRLLQARPLALHLDADMLAATTLALVGFPPHPTLG